MRCQFQRSTEIKVSITVFIYIPLLKKQNPGDINLKQISLRNIPGRL